MQTGIPRLRDRKKERERDGAPGEIFLFRNCITGMCDTTIGIGLASIFSLNVTEAFLVASRKLITVKSFEYMGIGMGNKMSAHYKCIVTTTANLIYCGLFTVVLSYHKTF